MSKGVRFRECVAGSRAARRGRTGAGDVPHACQDITGREAIKASGSASPARAWVGCLTSGTFRDTEAIRDVVGVRARGVWVKLHTFPYLRS